MAEETDRHSVLIVGIDGIPGGAVAASTRLEQKFRLPRPVADKLVSSIPAVVKKAVSMDDAQRYAAAIRSIGAEARIVPFSPNKKERAAVTGILKPRRPRASVSESKRADVGRSSGGYIAVNKRRERDGGGPRGEGTPAGGIAPASSGASARTDVAAPSVTDNKQAPAPAAKTSSPNLKETMMGTGFDPSAFALPGALGSVPPGARDAAPPPTPASVLDLFDDSAPEKIQSDEDFFGALSGDFGTVGDAEFLDDGKSLSASSAGGAAVGTEEGGRPSLFDELMALDDSGIGIGTAGGLGFGMSESGESKGRERKPAAKQSPAKPSASGGKKPKDSLELSGPFDDPAFASSDPEVKPPVNGRTGGVDQFGNLELGADPADSALQLDTDKPHLSGAFDAVDSAGFEVPEDDDFGLPVPAAQVRGTIQMSGLSDPLAAEIERTLAQSQPTERSRVSADGSVQDVTGGFSAAAERSRNSNSKFVRAVGLMILLTIVAGGAVAGFFFYERWAATLDATRFAEATNYFEHTVRLPASESGPASYVRGCAQLDPSAQTFSCRYSKEFYQFYFPGMSSSLQNAAPGSCFGTLTEGGAGSAEVLDCTVSASDGVSSATVRVYAGSFRDCATSLTSLESGGVAECTLRTAAVELSADASPPAGDEVAASFEFKRPFQLDTDVGDIGTREYLVTQDGHPSEYHHFAGTLGMLVRSAELGGAAGLRLTFADRGGSTAGHQAWPR